MKKILVYHLYTFDGFLEDDFVKLNKECLTDYINVFDECRFVIVVNDLNNSLLINQCMDWVCNICLGKKFSVKVKKNSELCEVDTFKEEILDNIDTLRDYVFFAHSKGTSNNTNVSGYNKESVMRWVCALYYFSLNFINEVIDNFSGKNGFMTEVFYGPLLVEYSERTLNIREMLNKNRCEYSGTFYWINMRKLSNYLKEGIIRLPEIDDRYWAEMLPGSLFSNKYFGSGLGSHKSISITDGFNLYGMSYDEWCQLSEILGEPDFIQYMNKKISTFKG